MASERPWLESLAACVPDPLILLREDGTILWANREFSDLVGVASAAKGHPVAQWIPEWRRLLSGLAEGEGRDSATLAVTNANGSATEVLATIALCRPGLDARWAIHLRDIGELRELQRRLYERERSYSFLRENTSDLIIRTDGDLIVTASNDSNPASFQPGESLMELIGATGRQRLLDLVAEGESGPVEVRLVSAPSHRPAFVYRAIARRLVDEQGMFFGFSLILRDDSESQALDRFVAELELSQREEQVIRYLVQGYSNLNIATILGLSESGVKFHIRNVYTRARVSTRTELMARIMEPQSQA